MRFLLPGLTPKAQWWLWPSALASFLLVAAVSWFARGNADAAVVYIGWAVFVMLSRTWARRAFRRGWHAGYVEAVQDINDGKAPLGAMRQMATGDPAAEPWDEFAYGLRMTITPHEQDDE